MFARLAARSVFLALCSFATACASPAKQAKPAPIPSTAPPAPSASAIAAADAAADAGSDASSKTRCLELAWSRTRCATPFRIEHPVDALEWLAQRGIKKIEPGVALPSKAFEHVNDYEGGCEPIAVGSPTEDALACSFGYGTMDGVAIGGLKVITVRKGRIVLLLEVIDEIGSMPVVPGEVDPFPLLFGLDVHLENAEREIVVAQPSPKSCAEANATFTAHGTRSKEEQDALLAAHRWLKKTCDGARRYVWTKGAFVATP